MLKDIRHGFRVLMQAKGWTVVVVLSLALGIGANIALFSTINGLVLKELPAVRDPGSLVRLRWVGENDMVQGSSDYGFTGPRGPGLQPPRATFSYPMFQQFQQANQTLTDLFATVPMSQAIAVIDGRAETVSMLLVSGNYHTGLGIGPRAGRMIQPADDSRSAHPVAVISSRFWASRFGSDPSAIGKVIRIGQTPVTLVGVAPSAFTGTQRLAVELHDVTMPIAQHPVISGEQANSDTPNRLRISDPLYWWVQVMGRLKPGGTPAQVHANFEAMFKDQARAGMDAYLADLPDGDRDRASRQGRTAVPNLIVEPAPSGIYDTNTAQVRALATIGAVTALVLLLVCANVANLLLSRAAARQKELSVRLSIGATRWRLVRQLMTESLVLATIGGVAGALVGIWAQELIPPPIGASSSIDWRVVFFTLGITYAAGVLFGIAPALRETRIDAGTAMSENSRTVAGTRSLIGRILIVVQVAISLVLLVGAGLFLKTLDNLRRVDVGFDPTHLVIVNTNPSGTQYDAARWFRYYEEGLVRLQRIPGVKSATLASPTMLSGNRNGTTIFVQGRVYPPGREASRGNDISRVTVAPSYFDTMGIRLAIGRFFTDADRIDRPSVAIINEAAVRKFFPNEHPIGKRFGTSVDQTAEYEIVGIVRDVRYSSLRDPAPATLYVPYLQRTGGGGGGIPFTIRTTVDPAQVVNAARDAIVALDPNVPVVSVQTQMSQIEQRMTQERVFAQAFAIFGILAVFIAGIGLFGLLSYGVARRTREIGIRMAMGAQRGEVLTLVIRESLVLVAVGVAIGLAGAVAGGRLIASQLYGLEPTDVTPMAAAVVLMLTVAALAGYLPARRAMRVDPLVALRYE